MDKTAATDAFWAAFAGASDIAGADYAVVAFGDTREVADELAALVLAGPKRATTGLLRNFGPGKEAMPRVGDHVVVVDGAGVPRCTWRTTQVDIARFGDVDARFARDEGEGDRSLAYWRDAHVQFFSRQAARERFTFDDRTDVVLERFAVVWPRDCADG